MPQELPYLPSYKNVATLFDKILTAKKPDTFTQAFLHDTLGLKSAGDRPLISLLKTLGFLDPGGRPTSAYDLLKNPAAAKSAIADAVRQGYAPLFSANEKANALSSEELKGLISQVSGADAGTVSKILGTFNALARAADFKSKPPSGGEKTEQPGAQHEPLPEQEMNKGSLRPDFHYNIQIHLPANGTEETYLNIFNAIRKTFK